MTCCVAGGVISVKSQLEDCREQGVLCRCVPRLMHVWVQVWWFYCRCFEEQSRNEVVNTLHFMSCLWYRLVCSCWLQGDLKSCLWTPTICSSFHSLLKSFFKWIFVTTKQNYFVFICWCKYIRAIKWWYATFCLLNSNTNINLIICIIIFINNLKVRY